jgi:hypothetical protein
MQEQQEKYPNDWPVITAEQERVKLGPPAVPPMPGMPEQAPKPKRRIGRWIVIGLIGFVGLGIVMSSVGGGSTAAPTTAPAIATPTFVPVTSLPNVPRTSPAVVAPPATQAPKPEFTVSQQNAIASAQDYLNYEAFSRVGLIGQLSSKYGEGFSKEDATFAVDHITVDWNEQAAKSAKEYLRYQSFSRNGLIQQLESQYGEQFTHAQAVYGVNQTGL